MAYWENNANVRVKFEGCNDDPNIIKMKEDRTSIYPCCETNLNFSTATCSEDDSEYGSYKKNKVTRQDPMSHRIIEKRRRDRMNNCLADLSRLIPTEYLKKGRGRIEKTEIIEMAIKHMKYLQQEHCSSSEHYRLGFQECMSETMRFMVETEGHFPREGICVRMLNHLQKHCDNLPVKVPNSVVPTVETKVETKTSSSEKRTEYNGVSYKYKTNIKLRFSQDLNAEETSNGKKPKFDDNQRRNSMVSVENQSSSHSSPLLSNGDTLLVRSESEHQTETSLSIKYEPPLNYYVKNTLFPNNSENFNVPIFVLHSKGAYYIPLTVDYKTLLPFLNNFDLLEFVSNNVLHPVTINVNFQPNFKVEHTNSY